MKSFTLTLSLIFVLSMVSHLYAESFPDCSATSGNSVIRRSGIGLNISLDSECSYTIPDMRSYWISRSGTRWRTYGVLRQIPCTGERNQYRVGSLHQPGSKCFNNRRFFQQWWNPIFHS
ncbi:MAG: hypothetical protein IPK94_08405 [Saprospiraceae bacterium]|nr:hypothetical protein [Saprospiraceae bacterium]